MSANGIDLTEKKDGGVIKEILKEGSGEAKPQKLNKVKVHYVGTLASDGSKFDSSRDRGEKFEFTLGKGEVIKAWDLGVASMKRGETALLTCAPEYAYGSTGSPPKIPPDSTLKFEVELFDWEAEDLSPEKDKGITRQLIVEGEKYTNPNDGATVNVTVKGWLSSDRTKPFFDSTLSFVLGEATAHGLPEGIDKALLRMNRGERSEIQLSPRWSYGTEGNTPLGVPGNSKVVFDVTLNSFEKQKQSWEMSIDEKIAESEKQKLRGTEFFQQSKFALAISKYKKIDELLSFEKNLEPSNQEKRDKLIIAANLNLALCHLKLGAFTDSIKHANSVLEIEPDNVKALYRRAQALEKQNDYEEAAQDYEHVLKVDPTNKAAESQIRYCKQKLHQYHEQEKARYRMMFSKMQASSPEPTDKMETESKEAQNGVSNGEGDANTHVVDAAAPNDQ